MKTSTDRILTTHTGSLPRPKPLLDIILRREQGEKIDAATFEAATAQAVDEVVAQQVASGVDIVSDGEMSKPSYTTYIRHRVEGIEHDPRAAEKGRDIMLGRDLIAHPDFGNTRRNFSASPFPGCVGPLNYKDRSALDRDLAHLKAAAAKHKPADVFMTAPSPGIVSTTMLNAYYDSHDAYLDAIAREMKNEYQAIAKAGLTLQIDAPDLAMDRTMMYRDLSDADFVKRVDKHIAVINAGIEGIPREQVRLHVCYGNWEGPHVHDIALAKILPALYQANVSALSIEFSNPRHAHEYAAFKKHPLPKDMLLVPGVIETTSNFVEHPEVVARRIEEAVAAVGERERVIAGTDCGFGTFAAYSKVDPAIAFKKLRALAQGAAIASKRLWN